MSEKITYGASRDKLSANGYRPMTATGSKGFLHADEPGAVALGFGDATYRTTEESGFRFREHSFLVALVVSAAVADKQVRSSIFQAIGRNIRSGPARTDGSGNVFVLARWMGSTVLPGNRSSSQRDRHGDPWVSLVTQTGDAGNGRFGVASSQASVLIPLAGEWSKGNPLETPFSKLPTLTDETFAVLWAELTQCLEPHAGYVAEEVPEPERVGTSSITPYVLTDDFQRRHGRMPEATAPVEEKRARWWSSFENMWREGT